jgi:hypothetical protein
MPELTDHELAQDMHRAENARGWSGSEIAIRKQRRGVLRLNMRPRARAVIIGLCLIDGCAFAQTTRTNPSAASTTATIPSSSSTSSNTPCNSFNPTSPCFSARIPRNPCYSAVAPDQPCSTTTTPNPQTSPTPLPLAPKAAPKGNAFTQDQAKAQIEAQGYSNVSGLRRDAKGIWQGKAEKDGLVGHVLLDQDGNVTAY